MGETNKQKSQEVINTEISQSREGFVKNAQGKWVFAKGHKRLSGDRTGTKNFDTLFEEAIKIIVKEKKIPGLKNPEIDLVIKAVVEGLKGNYNYFRDIMDRRFGRAKESIDISGDLKTTQVRELILTTRKILEIKPNGNRELQQSDNLRTGQEQI